MTTTEMILKIVMSPTDSPSGYAEQCRKLLPDLKIPEFQKILDMKVSMFSSHFLKIDFKTHKIYK